MVLLSQDLSATLISAWRKEELRNKLKALKKSVDDMDRHRKAQLVQNVSMCICIYIVWMSLSLCVCVCVCVYALAFGCMQPLCPRGFWLGN